MRLQENDTLKKLLSSVSDEDETSSRAGWTPMGKAVRYRNTDAADLILSAGLRLGATAMDVFNYKGTLSKEFRMSAERVEAVLGTYIANAVSERYSFQDQGSLKRSLKKSLNRSLGLKETPQNSPGETFLHRCIKRDGKTLLEYCIENGIVTSKIAEMLKFQLTAR